MIVPQEGTLYYYRIYGKYGLLKDRQEIVKIHSWANSGYCWITPDDQELFFNYGFLNMKSGWAFTTDFECFSNRKKELKKYKKKR